MDGPALLFMCVTLLMVLGGMGKKRLEWRPRPIRLRLRRRR
ncbi:MAG TPA: hypothetical protein VFU56_03475 [Gaiellaceae bacterium]|nr:hypothetical protein [Gaiellaceae bacterium]